MGKSPLYSPHIIERLIDRYYHCKAREIRKIGEGLYGVVYKIILPTNPKALIIKCYKNPDRHKQEKGQLDLLRPHSLVKIPHIYHTHNASRTIPMDALFMEYVEGVNASTISPSHPNHKRLTREIVENLLHLHSTSHPEGFAFYKDAFCPDWEEYFYGHIMKLYRPIINHPALSYYVMKHLDNSISLYASIFRHKVTKSSLVHSDYNLWNILVDPDTCRITAILDPLQAGYADREFDLFHLQNAHGDRFGLLEDYHSRYPLSPLYPVKEAFYWLWDDVKHTVNMGWYDDTRFRHRCKKLDSAIKRYL